jgi:hypothetical protein
VFYQQCLLEERFLVMFCKKLIKKELEEHGIETKI